MRTTTIPLPSVRLIVMMPAVVTVRSAKDMRAVMAVRPAGPETVRPAGPRATTTADATKRSDDRLDRIGGLLVRHGKSIYVT